MTAEKKHYDDNNNVVRPCGMVMKTIQTLLLCEPIEQATCSCLVCIVHVFMSFTLFILRAALSTVSVRMFLVQL